MGGLACEDGGEPVIARRWRTAAVALTASLLTGCAGILSGGGAPAPVPPDTIAVRDTAPLALRWSQHSAEHRAIFFEVYRMAEEHLREMSVAYPAGTWAVILDADETVLDNSEYQARLARSGESYDTASWNAWVREEVAPALPGAADFIRFARELGGRVVIVTNRDDAVCPATRENLARLEVTVDLVLCKPPGPSSKQPRFDAVQKGTASPSLPALNVLMWVGDNIQDFPGLSQATGGEEAYEPFGRKYIILPNPMYGSWER